MKINFFSSSWEYFSDDDNVMLQLSVAQIKDIWYQGYRSGAERMRDNLKCKSKRKNGVYTQRMIDNDAKTFFSNELRLYLCSQIFNDECIFIQDHNIISKNIKDNEKHLKNYNVDI